MNNNIADLLQNLLDTDKTGLAKISIVKHDPKKESDSKNDRYWDFFSQGYLLVELEGKTGYVPITALEFVIGGESYSRSIIAQEVNERKIHLKNTNNRYKYLHIDEKNDGLDEIRLDLDKLAAHKAYLEKRAYGNSSPNGARPNGQMMGYIISITQRVLGKAQPNQQH